MRASRLPELPHPHPSEELLRLRRRVAELEAREAERLAGKSGTQATDAPAHPPVPDVPLSGEDVLRAILDNIPDAVWLKDAEGRIVAGNQALADFCTRQTLDRVIGRTFGELLPKRVAEKLETDDVRLLRQRERHTTEARLDIRGDPRWFEIVRSPVIGAGGILAGSTGIAHNVTQHKLMQQALRQSEARFRQFAEDLPFVIWMARPRSLEVVFVNRCYEEVFGRSLEQLRENPRDWLVAVHPEDRRRLPSPAVLGERRGVLISEFRILRPDGETRWLRNHAIPLEDENGTIYLHAGIAEDITERKRDEEEIRRFNAELEARVRSRTDALQASLSELESFSYSVSHDLRTPLRAINGYSHLLLEDHCGALDETARGYLSKIRGATERMGQLIDDLLTLSRISRAETHPEPVDLSRLAAEVLDELRAEASERVVETVVADGLSVRGDPSLLRVLLENLLGNAWKFTRDANPACIELGRLQKTGREQVLFVRDNGAGFDGAYASKLFRPFQRLHATDEFPGSGIGLATVRRIVERHGGRIWARGEPGRGATVCFTLPERAA